MEEYVEQKRFPPDRDFSALESNEFRLDTRLYLCITWMLPRMALLDGASTDLGEGFNVVHDFVYEEAWTDEESFYEWLMGQKFSKELATFLYEQTPEITLNAGASYLYGVKDLIELNEHDFRGFIVSKPIRQAGLLIIGSGKGDTLVVMDLVESRGRICYIPTNEEKEMSVIEIRNSLIEITSSIGNYITEFEKEVPQFPDSYEQAEEIHTGVDLDYSHSQDLQDEELIRLWTELNKLLAKIKDGYHLRIAEHEVARMDLSSYTRLANATNEQEDEDSRLRAEKRCKQTENEEEKAERYYGKSLIIRERYSKMELTLDRKRLILFDLEDLRGLCSELDV